MSGNTSKKQAEAAEIDSPFISLVNKNWENKRRAEQERHERFCQSCRVVMAATLSLVIAGSIASLFLLPY